MEYKKLNKEDVAGLTEGQVINLGNGELLTFIDSFVEDTRFFGKQETVHVKTEDGITKSFRSSVLEKGTIETSDKTIVKCEYCESLRPKNETKRMKIYKNRSNVFYSFCSDKSCGGYYQMGYEG